MTNLLLRLVLLTAVISTLLTSANAEQQIETLPIYIPIESSEHPQLLSQLRQALLDQGLQDVDLINIDFWHPYQQGLREGRYGIYFAQPHFAAWALHKHNFSPIFKLHGRMKYVLATQRANTEIFEVRDLAGKSICRQPGLNLGTVWLNQLLGKHRLTAIGKEVQSITSRMLAKSEDCDAFVVDIHSYQRVNAESNASYILLAQSPSFKQHAFIAHPDVPEWKINRLKQALKSKQAKKVLLNYFSSLSKWQNLLPIKSNDYDQQDTQMLMPYWQSDRF